MGLFLIFSRFSDGFFSYFSNFLWSPFLKFFKYFFWKAQSPLFKMNLEFFYSFQHFYWLIWMCFNQIISFLKFFLRKKYFNAIFIHFLVGNKKLCFFILKIQWVFVSYYSRIWWVVSYKSVSYRKGQREHWLDFCPRPARKETNVPLHKRS